MMVTWSQPRYGQHKEKTPTAKTQSSGRDSICTIKQTS